MISDMFHMTVRVLVTIIVLLATRKVAAQDFELPKLDPKKFTICTITINSDNEKKVFDSQVKKDPKSFNPIVELTEFGEDDWFSKACSSGVHCDQLVVSGHFAGTFFGQNKSKSLSIEELESRGCSHTCDGVLSDPYEVFLFGCNTLAEKERDHRTPEEYLTVLLQDGIPRAEANRIVAARYGEMGDSFRSSMKRAFGGQRKQLYGFGSVGPSGQNVERMLKNYMSTSNLKQRLERLEISRIKSKTSFFNEKLANALRSTAFNQCLAGFDVADEKAAIICGMMDRTRSIEERIGLLKQALSRKDFLAFVPRINSFFDSLEIDEFDQAKITISQSAVSPVVKDRLNSLIETTTDLDMLYEWTSFSHNIGLTTFKQQRQILSKRVNDKIGVGLLQSDVDMICSVAPRIRSMIDLSWQEIEQQELSGLKLKAVACLVDRKAPKSVQIRILEDLKSNPTSSNLAYRAVERMLIKNAELQLDFLDLVKSSPPVLKLLTSARGSAQKVSLRSDIEAKLIDIVVGFNNDKDRKNSLSILAGAKKLELSLVGQRKLLSMMDDSVSMAKGAVVRIILNQRPNDRDIQLRLLKELDDKTLFFRKRLLGEMKSFLLNDPELQEKWKVLFNSMNTTLDTDVMNK